MLHGAACERPNVLDERRHPGQFRLPAAEGESDGNGYFYDSAHENDPCGREDSGQGSWPRMWGGLANSTCEIKCDEEQGYTNTLGVVYKCQADWGGDRYAFAWRVAGDYLCYLKASLDEHAHQEQTGRKRCVLPASRPATKAMFAPKSRSAPASESQEY